MVLPMCALPIKIIILNWTVLNQHWVTRGNIQELSCISQWHHTYSRNNTDECGCPYVYLATMIIIDNKGQRLEHEVNFRENIIIKQKLSYHFQLRATFLMKIIKLSFHDHRRLFTFCHHYATYLLETLSPFVPQRAIVIVS